MRYDVGSSDVSTVALVRTEAESVDTVSLNDGIAVRKLTHRDCTTS